MAAPARLALFLVTLLAVGGLAAILGSAVGASADTAGPAEHGTEHSEHHPGAAGPATLPGLAVAEGGFRLVLDSPAPTGPGSADLAFRILDAEGAPVRRFEVNHTKKLHLIVVRRDLTRFLHLHPEQAADGTWRARLALPTGGTYRLFADFTVDGRQRTLGTDLQVPGAFTPQPLPAAEDTVRDDRGLEVRRRTEGGTTAFEVFSGGRLVNAELEEHLGAKGHLVTLRAGDVAYLHTHPASDRLAFEVELPSAGSYRSWVQFKLDGIVHTAAFRQDA